MFPPISSQFTENRDQREKNLRNKYYGTSERKK